MSPFTNRSSEEGMSTLTMAMSVLAASVVLGLAFQQSSDMMVSTGRAQVEIDEGMSTTISASAVLRTLLQSGLVFETKAGVMKEDRSQGGVSIGQGTSTSGTNGCESGRFPYVDLRALPTSPAFGALPPQFQDSDTESRDRNAPTQFSGRETEWKFRKPDSSHSNPTIYVYQCSSRSSPDTVICPSDQRVVSKFEFTNRRPSSLGAAFTSYDITILSRVANKEVKKKGSVTVRQIDISESPDFTSFSAKLHVLRRGSAASAWGIYANNPQQYDYFELFVANPSENAALFNDFYSSSLTVAPVVGGTRGVPGVVGISEAAFQRATVAVPAGSAPPLGNMRYINTRRTQVQLPTVAVPLYGNLVNFMQPCNRSRDRNCNLTYRVLPHEASVVQCLNGKLKSRIIRLTTGDLYAGGICGSGSAALPAGVEPTVCAMYDQISPLVVDFSNKGVVFESSKKVSFDFKNGMPATNWISSKSDAGFVVLDKNKNGKVDSIEEMFGDRTVGPDDRHSADGFAALAKYDDNKDSVIDSQDTIFSDLKIWKDRNSNGVTEKSELHSIQSTGLTSISLNQEHLDRFRDENGNHVSGKSVATSASGKNYSVYDAWFGH